MLQRVDSRPPPEPTEAAPCPACGASLGGRVGCQAAFDALVAASWVAPAPLRNLAVDAYCLQHPDDYCQSAKSYAAHLAGLCCGVELGGDPGVYRSVARWLDGQRDVVKPAVLPNRGRTTVADVFAAPAADYEPRVRAWARAVWAAYTSQHALARGWLAAARTGGPAGSGARR